MTVLACDMGGTRIKLGLVRQGQVLGLRAIPAHSDQGLATRLPVIAEEFQSLAAETRVRLEECLGLAVSFPSLVDHASGRILYAYGKYADAPEIDLRAWSRATLGLPLAIENDARMASIGEWRHGAGRGCDNLVMVTLGTGIGTSAIIGGRVIRGVHGQAGCLGGHTTVRLGGRACSCGNVGCAEAEASTAFLARIARDRGDFAASALTREAVLDYAAVFRLASAGDPVALQLRQHSLTVWGTLIVNLIHAYDPERVIVGGGIMASADAILPGLREYVGRHAHTPWGRVEILASELGDRAALAAAEWLVTEQREEAA